MAKRGSGLKLVADFTEELVGFALESYLSFVTFPFRRFSIEPFSQRDERELGVDARLLGEAQSFKPFYMQFKRPFAYPEESRSSIIKDRKKLSLEVSPYALFFPLREKRANHTDYQHNILYALRKKLLKLGTGDACYVCPAFLARSAYRHHVHLSALRNWWPWRLTPFDCASVVVHEIDAKVSFSNVPLLAEHISIPPHVSVTTARHTYSFSEKCEQVCFHSDAHRIRKGPSTLGKLLDRIQAQETAIEPRNALKQLEFLVAERDEQPKLPHPEGLFETRDGIAAWLRWGAFVRDQWGIEQYAFVQWSSD